MSKLRLFFILLLTACSSPPKKQTQPNIIIIITDQERYPAHWPQGWAEKNLPSYTRLKKHGMTFHRAYTAASKCAPSRAVMMTSEHYPINQVPHTPAKNGLPTDTKLMDLGRLLKQYTDYEVVWKGKWHLSPPLNGSFKWSEKDIGNIAEKYDLYGWNPPDAGNAEDELVKTPAGTFNGLTTLGGGIGNNDLRYLYGTSKTTPEETPGWGEGVLEYLKKPKKKPFCLFISLVNPHDIWVYPVAWKDAGYKREEFADVGIDLPSNFADDLTTKPSIQAKVRDIYQEKSPLAELASEKEYVNFYAYLHKVVDGHIQTILDALDAAGLTENTIIIRTADHGELGLSHGMRQKAFTAYEEMIHVPFVVSNPKMFPTAQSTEAFYSHLDFLPTIAELAGVPAKFGKGVSLAPVLKNQTPSVQDSILFTFDDLFMLPENVPSGHIRAIREGDWMYAVYYSENGSDFEYEMYNLKQDPGQLHNLLFQNVSRETAAEALRLHARLKEKIDASCALPAGITWPTPSF